MTARCIWAFKSFFPTPSSFSSWSHSDVCLYAYTGRTVSITQMHTFCWNHPLIKYDQKNFAIHAIHEGRYPNSSSKTLKISMPTYQFMKGMSKTKSMPPPPKFATFKQQKIGTLSPFIVTLIFWLYPPIFKFRGRRHCFLSWTSRSACWFSKFDYLNLDSFPHELCE